MIPADQTSSSSPPLPAHHATAVGVATPPHRILDGTFIADMRAGEEQEVGQLDGGRRIRLVFEGVGEDGELRFRGEAPGEGVWWELLGEEMVGRGGGGGLGGEKGCVERVVPTC